jgi:hypothetical protein
VWGPGNSRFVDKMDPVGNPYGNYADGTAHEHRAGVAQGRTGYTLAAMEVDIPDAGCPRPHLLRPAT